MLETANNTYQSSTQKYLAEMQRNLASIYEKAKKPDLANKYKS